MPGTHLAWPDEPQSRIQHKTTHLANIYIPGTVVQSGAAQRAWLEISRDLCPQGSKHIGMRGKEEKMTFSV